MSWSTNNLMFGSTRGCRRQKAIALLTSALVQGRSTRAQKSPLAAQGNVRAAINASAEIPKMRFIAPPQSATPTGLQSSPPVRVKPLSESSSFGHQSAVFDGQNFRRAITSPNGAVSAMTEPTMRVRGYLAIFIALLVADVCAPHRAVAAPAQNGLKKRIDDFQLVEDTCWWWGLRWQYGWRGYGWYACWDWVKPQPTVIAPEAVPEDALTAQSCVRRWRDSSGNWHARRVC